MAGINITPFLEAGLNPDPAVRQHGEQQLAIYEQQDAGKLALLLITELANESKPQGARQIAGVYVKNMVAGRSTRQVEEKAARWLSIDPALRAQIQQGSLTALHQVGPANKISRDSASLVISSIGAVEMRAQQWGNLVETLVTTVIRGPDDQGLRVSVVSGADIAGPLRLSAINLMMPRIVSLRPFCC